MSKLRAYLGFVAVVCALSPFAAADVQMRKSEIIHCSECWGSSVIERGDAVFLNGEVFMRLHVKDGATTRVLEGTLSITELGLSGRLFEWGDSPCGGRWQVHRVVTSLSH